MKNETVHSTLLALVGGYLLYMAYQILGNYRSGAGEMPDYLYIIVIALMSLAGLGVIYYAWVVYRNARRAGKAADREEEDNG